MGIVGGGDGDAGPLARIDGPVEQAIGRRIGVPLQMPADLAGTVAQPVRLPRIGGQQQQPCRLDRAGREHHDIAGDRGAVPPTSLVLPHQLEAGDLAFGVGLDAVGQRFGRQMQIAGGERLGDERVLRAVLAVRGTGKAHATAAFYAGVAPVMGNRIDQQRRLGDREAERLGRFFEDRRRLVARHGRQRQAGAAEGLVRQRAGGAGDAERLFGPAVPGLEIGIGDGPVDQARSRRDAIAAGHAEIVGMKAPGLPAIDQRAAAHAGGIVAIGDGMDRLVMLDTIRRHHDARPIVGRGAGIVAIDRVAVIAQMVAMAAIGIGQPLATLDQQHLPASEGELAGDHTAAGARADHDGVVAAAEIGLRPGWNAALGRTVGPFGQAVLIADFRPRPCAGISAIARIGIDRLGGPLGEGGEPGAVLNLGEGGIEIGVIACGDVDPRRQRGDAGFDPAAQGRFFHKAPLDIERHAHGLAAKDRVGRYAVENAVEGMPVDDHVNPGPCPSRGRADGCASCRRRAAAARRCAARIAARGVRRRPPRRARNAPAFPCRAAPPGPP